MLLLVLLLLILLLVLIYYYVWSKRREKRRYKLCETLTELMILLAEITFMIKYNLPNLLEWVLQKKKSPQEMLPRNYCTVSSLIKRVNVLMP